MARPGFEMEKAGDLWESDGYAYGRLTMHLQYLILAVVVGCAQYSLIKESL